MGSARVAGWRRRRPRLRGAGSWYLTGAVSLTIVCLLAPVLAPTPGLTRSYHYPLGNPDATVVEERITSVDLAFIDAQSRPTRNYRVVWRGVWFSPRAERIDFHVAADDGVVVRLDGETVIERNPQVGTGRAVRTVELDAGAHQLEIDHWQRGAERRLHLEWASAGGEPAPLGADRLFRENPGPAYWLLVASPALRMLVLLVWAAGLTVLLGLTVYRRASALTGQELATRVRVMLLPALLGPSQLLLFGPWTVHATNRTEFLVSFWNLAPYWLWLLVPIAGILTVLGSVLPARWFPRYVAGLCAVGVLLWVQGNLLVADYGLLDGQGLDLAPHAWRTTVEVGLWTGGIALAVIFAATVVRTAPLASGLLLAFQTILLLLPPMESVAGLLPAAPRTGAPTPAGGCRRRKSTSFQAAATSSTSCSTCSRRTCSPRSQPPIEAASTATGPGSRSSRITWAPSARRRAACRRCSPGRPTATKRLSTSSWPTGRASRFSTR